MTDNTANNGGADTGSGSGSIAIDSPDEQADMPEDIVEIGDLPEDLTEIDDDESDAGRVRGTGAVSGAAL